LVFFEKSAFSHLQKFVLLQKLEVGRRQSKKRCRAMEGEIVKHIVMNKQIFERKRK